MFSINTLDTTHYLSEPITGVALESVLMRNAPTALTADYDNGKASFTMNANMAQAYKTVYSDYHTPEGTEPKEAPFRLELRYDSRMKQSICRSIWTQRRKPSPSATMQSHPQLSPAPIR